MLTAQTSHSHYHYPRLSEKVSDLSEVTLDDKADFPQLSHDLSALAPNQVYLSTPAHPAIARR